MMQHGFQRLVLLGSAGYRRAELPLDDSVSLVAPNNTGKTSLINALQFLLIIDRRRMDFGAHQFDKTRRFYFPGNSAYILLEVSLPQTGTVVLGCVGKGVSHDYEYFAYKGPLDVADYRLPDGALVDQPRLVSHLAECNRLVFRYGATDFRDLIYGGRRTRGANEPDFTVFRLEHASDAQAFQQVLTRTLRLDKLTSADVKNYLLQIFKRDLPDASIDFKQEWDKAFAEVNTERAWYEAAVKARKEIDAMARQYEERLALRGKLIDWRPRIDHSLGEWQAYYEQRREALGQEHERLRLAQRQQTERFAQLTSEYDNLQRQVQQLDQTERQQAELAQRFALIATRRELEEQLGAVKRRLDAQITLIGQVSGRSISAITRDRQRLQQQANDLERRRQTLDDNLYRRLSAALSEADLERLNRVLSAPVMSLAPADFRLDAARLRQLLSEGGADHLRLPGLSLSLTALSPQHEQLSEQELQAELADTRRQLQSLVEQLRVAEQLQAAQNEQQRLDGERRRLEQDLQDYDLLQRLCEQAAARQDEQARLNARQVEVAEEQRGFQTQVDQLQDRLDEVRNQQSLLEDRHERIERTRRQRADDAPVFDYLSQLDHHVWVGETLWSLDELATRLEHYQNDCRHLLELDRGLEQRLRELHAAGLTKYQYSEQHDEELKRIIEFREQLSREREALEKKARSAVVNVTASLRELRDGLLSFKSRMREFNRLIGRRQLSDLDTFKIEPEDEPHLVEAITILINTASQAETGDSFELFNQTSVLDDVQLDRAKQILIEEGNARQGLRVADLFRLEFVVGKTAQPTESFEDIDSAASNGTVLMAKLITGLAMLHLMQDKRHNLRAVCYLDEALALDARNQTSLIETASEFGFALIFASPAPLITARYCVPIHTRDGKNHISRQSWQVLEPLAERRA